MSSIAVVIQTCDKYKFLWEGWTHYFLKYWDFNGINVDVFFCTEHEVPMIDPSSGIAWLTTGEGPWGARLLRILNLLHHETIFYMQEDFWMHRPLPAHVFKSRYDHFRVMQMDAYRCCAPSKHFKLLEGAYPRRFRQDSPYLVTHQASFWDKNFLKSCILPHEDPWQNEKMGTKRLAERQIAPSIYFAPFDFYHTVCCKGNLTELGVKLNDPANYAD